MSETIVKPISMDIMEIMDMIPHRYPFFIGDRITECIPGEYSKGYKNLTANEMFLTDTFRETLLCRVFCRLKLWRKLLPNSFDIGTI